MSDWTKGDPQAWRQYAQHVLADMLPKLTDSALSISLCPSGAGPKQVGDVKYWVELGATIMLDKPIIVVCQPGQVIPERLERVADEVVRVDLDTEAGMKELAERIVLLTNKLEESP